MNSSMGGVMADNLFIFYEEITSLEGEERAVDIVYLDFSKAFDTVSYKILIEELMCGLDEPTAREYTKPGEVADMPGSCAALDRDLDRLEKRSNSKLKFNKEKCRVLNLGRSNPMYQCMLGATQLESRLAEKALSVLVDPKLNISQLSALAVEKTNGILGCFTQSTDSRKVILSLC
ncbi:rna-directed dna polymerase from mobile element jockey-like [Limosa lapponica baueri]|uniref:Rna-directed dna polymerase from mobile element jockey-like n=1 Tax=Limosa lapponica baueri TaxID=1758121 RepID=A0A2I0UFL3_LIMLA|nr:rna-directed dna polymerase from mobile element jockey-like [Limosa lapponica baueri]